MSTQSYETSNTLSADSITSTPRRMPASTIASTPPSFSVSTPGAPVTPFSELGGSRLGLPRELEEPLGPRCRKCRNASERRITGLANRNGNAGRLYYKCTNPSCGQFLGFADERGLDATNPQCHCGLSTRRQVEKQKNGGPRGVFFTCMQGSCSFYEALRRQDQTPVMLTDEIVNTLAGLRLGI